MKTNTIGTIFITFLVIGLCVAVGYFAWAPNMEADYVGFGFLGVLLPVVAIIGAFTLGVGTGLSMDVPEDSEIESAHRPSF